MRSLLLLAALVGMSDWTLAQSRSGSNPADPRAPAPRPEYQSAFSDYRLFQDEKVRSWKDVNKEVADNAATGSMQHKPGATMPGTDPKSDGAPTGKGGHAGHDMGSMKDKPGAPMPGSGPKAGVAPKGKADSARHDMASMHHKPGKAMSSKDKPAAVPASKADHHTIAMAKPQSAPGKPATTPSSGITGTGVVQSVDKVNARVRLTHDPIAAMGWPKMTMLFRLKESSLADQVKAGDEVEFSLEKSVSGYVISGFRKSASGQVLAHDDKPKPKPEAAKDDKKGDHKGKDHDKKH